MAKNSSILLITILSLSLLGSALMIPETFAAGSSTLTVTVSNQSTSNPISGATVSISGPETHSAITGSDGKVVFSNLAAGDYHLTASAPGYSTKVSSDIHVDGATAAYATFGFTKAFFTYLPDLVMVNATVFFDASLSNSSGTILSYVWSFGDNTNGTGISPSHIFSRQGTYTVYLTVISNVGTATYSRNVVVGTTENGLFPWILLLLLLIPIPIFLIRRRRYYVVIQARTPPRHRHVHCPGNDTICEECKMAPC